MWSMKLRILCVAALLLAGCANQAGTAANPDGARSPLTNPGANTLNSPTTAPSSVGVPGGPVGSGSGSPGAIPMAVGRR